MTAPAGDGASATVFVRVAPEDAFEVFTHEIDLWWKTGPAYRIAGRRVGKLVFEERLGGGLFETVELASGPKTFQVGTVTVWEPPARLSLEWRGVNFKPGEVTFVDVTFQAFGEGTKVTVRHHGFAALRDDHPVRHGKAGAEFSRSIGLWWGSLMTALREHIEARDSPLTQ